MKISYLLLTTFLYPLVVLAENEIPEISQYQIQPASIQCVVEAANRQNVPANVLLAIASVEGGKNGQFVPNSNGTKDIGHFQINSVHFRQGELFEKGRTLEDAAWRGCYNAELAAKLLKLHLDSKDSSTDYWTRVANYHSKTKKYNEIYKSKIVPLAIKWGDFLRKNYTQVSIVQR